MPSKQCVAFEFVCERLPGNANLYLALQEGKDIVQEIPADSDQAVFRFALDVQFNPENDAPNFTGPYAQGTATSRFVYLCWGERRDGVWATVRRAKVPLSDLSAADVRAAIAINQPLRARISMTDTTGQPVAASLKPGQFVWEPLSH